MGRRFSFYPYLVDWYFRRLLSCENVGSLLVNVLASVVLLLTVEMAVLHTVPKFVVDVAQSVVNRCQGLKTWVSLLGYSQSMCMYFKCRTKKIDDSKMFLA